MLARPFVGVVVLVSLLAPCGAPGNEARQEAASPRSATSTPPPAVSPTRAPKPSSKPKPSPKPPSCPSPALRGVYHPYRLQVLGTCRRYRGVVIAVRSEEDGDYHVVIRPDPGFGGFLDQGDVGSWEVDLPPVEIGAADTPTRSRSAGGRHRVFMGIAFYVRFVDELGTWRVHMLGPPDLPIEELP